ncbi:MAG: immune inhibitor A [Bacteroidales bacterium]|nr:immune inhibitor A [Bacteroidales bacterium]
MKAFLLAAVFRMIVLPVQFEDRQFSSTRAGQEALVQQAQRYFERQFAGSDKTFEFVLAPSVTLSHPVAWYGANYPERKDIRIGDAVQEACLALRGKVDFASYDNDQDGLVDNVFLLFAGPGEHASGEETDLYPQQGRLSASGNPFGVGGVVVDSFAAAPEQELSVWCHEFGHVLGLPDLYDTDGEQSGGLCRGLWGLSLMDDGCRKETPPDFGAPEYHLLGLGTGEKIQTGSFTLLPLSAGHRYLWAETEKADEYFLFEARGGGLYVYHIDRSDNPAGFSMRQQEELTARRRWELDEINNNPEHPCVRLIPAHPAATDVREIPFFEGSFGSDTPAAFRSWGGVANGLALTDIHPDGDGGVAFRVVRPITLTDQAVYQDAALIRWSTDLKPGSIRSYEFSWSDGAQTERRELPADAVSYTIERLHPNTEYTFSLRLRAEANAVFAVDGSFTTKVQRKGTYPYIYLNSTTRNADGSFPIGGKIPLRIFNAPDVVEVHWTMDGKPIAPGQDGFYVLQSGGELRAKIRYADGTSETLLKQIVVR